MRIGAEVKADLRASKDFLAVRATADGGAELAGDPKVNIFTE